jgi:voltage-gated potassium channel
MPGQSRTLNLRAELFVLALALISIGLLIYEITAELQPHQYWILDRVDIGIAFVFLLDFLWRWRKADDRARFFRKSWWELLAAIPLTYEATQALRGLRLLRLVQLVRLLRVARFAVRLKIVLDRVRVFGERTHLVTVTAVVFTIVMTGAAAFHYFEFGRNPNVHGFGDSVWWSIITVTTVGYGDIAPVTTAGRIVATLLLITGLGTFGTWAAAMAAWIVESRKADETGSSSQQVFRSSSPRAAEGGAFGDDLKT